MEYSKSCKSISRSLGSFGSTSLPRFVLEWKLLDFDLCIFPREYIKRMKPSCVYVMIGKNKMAASELLSRDVTKDDGRGH